MKNFLQIPGTTKLVKIVLLIGLIVLLFSYTLPWILHNGTSREYSGIDFHGYWYAGHYTRAGVNPYWAIVNKNPFPVYWDPRFPGSGVPYQLGTEDGGVEADLELPIYYLDGPAVRDYPVAQVLIVVPAATAPLNLFMGLFSWLSWPIARSIWLGLNIVLAIFIPWLGFRLFENFRKISCVDSLILAFAFYNFYGLRQSLVVGQQSVICLFLLLLAMLYRDRWLLAGLLLGFGISKYSVGLPIFLLFLLQKRTRVVAVSLVVQLVGVLLLMPLAHGSIIETVKAYLKALSLNYSQEGVHMLARFPDNHFVGYLFVVAILIALAFLIKDVYFRINDRGIENNAVQLNILSLMTVGLFLAVYHRIHDLPFMIFFFLTAMAVQSGSWKLVRWENSLMVSAYLLLIGLLILPTIPGKIFSYLQIPASAIDAFVSENAISTFALVLMFAVSAWLQIKIFTLSNQSQVLKEEQE